MWSNFHQKNENNSKDFSKEWSNEVFLSYWSVRRQISLYRSSNRSERCANWSVVINVDFCRLATKMTFAGRTPLNSPMISKENPRAWVRLYRTGMLNRSENSFSNARRNQSFIATFMRTYIQHHRSRRWHQHVNYQDVHQNHSEKKKTIFLTGSEIVSYSYCEDSTNFRSKKSITRHCLFSCQLRIENIQNDWKTLIIQNLGISLSEVPLRNTFTSYRTKIFQ